MTVALVGALAAPTAQASPPLLSADGSSVPIASTYGSGNLGRWDVDRFGLPVYHYLVDELTDPRAKQPELLNGDTKAQHQLGNDNIVAAAWNRGDTMLWSQARLPQWANAYEPNTEHYAGGYGFLNTGGKVYSTDYEDQSPGATVTRDFGVGYYRRQVTTASGIDVDEVVYAPFGDDPLLLHDVSISNTTSATRKVSWFEYWDVNPYTRNSLHDRGIDAPTWDPQSHTLQVGQDVDEGDTAPLSIFASALQGPVGGFETSIDLFFGTGTKAAPAEVAADRLSGTIAPPAPVGLANRTLFVLRAPLTLAPGQTVMLRYAYGMAHPEQIAGLVAKYRQAPDPFATSERAWGNWLPKADFGSDYAWVNREFQWDAYLLRSASVWEEECHAHTITQGGYYQYALGYNLGYRSWLHYMLPMAYSDPALAREILRYSIQLQPELANNEVPYGTGPLCTRFDLGTSNDLNFWLLLAAGEYGLGTRDTHFFDTPMPFYDTHREVSAWEHIKLAYRSMETKRGPHGGYIMGATGDWSDFSTELGPMTESTLVALQLAYAYPKLAELADLRGDRAFATELRARAAQIKQTMKGEWTGMGWYSRGYFGDKQIGKGMPFGEPQPWALLAGIPDDQQRRTLVANIRRFLTGIGAPGGPTKIGSAMAPARDDPDITERGPAVDPTDGALPDVVGTILGQIPGAPLNGAAAYPGGVWFDVNGWLTWALAEQDGIVPLARDYAWDEYTRNTLATHATVFPDHWDGTISIDDACSAWYSASPANCGIGVPFWEGQITEQPTWMVMDAIRLVGITPDEQGWTIAPHVPQSTFSLRTGQIGVAGQPHQLRGYVRPEQEGRVVFRVRVPHGARSVATWIDGARVPVRLVDGYALLPARTHAHRATDWAVTWS